MPKTQKEKRQPLDKETIILEEDILKAVRKQTKQKV